jgi:hypothetical protein
MTHANDIAESLVRRLQAQHGPLGVDVHLHLANVREMCERLPGQVKNPAGLLVDWCQREADARQAGRAARDRDRERYAELQVEVYRAVAAGRFTPRVLARVLTQASREGYPALNPRCIELLRSMEDRWDADPAWRDPNTEGPSHAGARDATGRTNQAAPTGRSVDAGVPSA